MADVWHRAERGDVAPQLETVTFATWAALVSVMTDRRHELLRHLHTHPVSSIRALARDPGRDFKRVHEDVTALDSIGLIEGDGGILRAGYDEIQATIPVGSCAM